MRRLIWSCPKPVWFYLGVRLGSRILGFYVIYHMNWVGLERILAGFSRKVWVDLCAVETTQEALLYML